MQLSASRCLFLVACVLAVQHIAAFGEMYNPVNLTVPNSSPVDLKGEIVNITRDVQSVVTRINMLYANATDAANITCDTLPYTQFPTMDPFASGFVFSDFVRAFVNTILFPAAAHGVACMEQGLFGTVNMVASSGSDQVVLTLDTFEQLQLISIFEDLYTAESLDALDSIATTMNWRLDVIALALERPGLRAALAARGLCCPIQMTVI